LGIAQVWSVGWDTLNNVAFAGFQDTAYGDESATGSTAWGSGITTTAVYNRMFDQANAYTVQVDNSQFAITGQVIRYYVGTNFNSVARKAFNASGAQVGATTFLTFSGPGTPGTPQSGIVPVDKTNNWIGENIPIVRQLNQNDPRRALYGTTDLYEDSDPNGVTGAIVNRVTPIGMTGNITALDYGGRRDGLPFNQIAFVGTSTGELWVRNEFGVNFALQNLPGSSGPVNSVILDPDNWRHAFVLVGGTKVYENFNVADPTAGGWVDVTFNLDGPPTADGTPGSQALTRQSTSVRRISRTICR
jgi:hypothetical protein